MPGAGAAADSKSRIRTFLAENFLFRSDGFPYGDDESLFEAGVVDSMGILELTLFVEETFGIDVPDDDVVPDNFDSVEKLATYIESRK
ncbi:MAG: phosphopantetheine-binding protein [Planctomycetota bacterium]|jgi:acyl carrier protein